jgi:hypothetical protein
MSASSSWSGSAWAGQPARKIERGASGIGPATRRSQRCSVRNGMTGATTRSALTSDDHSVERAAGSPFQNRRRDRRTYQLERSSTYSSKARRTLTERYSS